MDKSQNSILYEYDTKLLYSLKYFFPYDLFLMKLRKDVSSSTPGIKKLFDYNVMKEYLLGKKEY